VSEREGAQVRSGPWSMLMYLSSTWLGSSRRQSLLKFAERRTTLAHGKSVKDPRKHLNEGDSCF